MRVYEQLSHPMPAGRFARPASLSGDLVLVLNQVVDG
jgi:hypothetical protein